MTSGLLDEAVRLAQGPDPAAARPLIDALLSKRDDDPAALTLLGLVAQRTGDDAMALDAFARARAGDPDNPARIGNHAIALKRVGQFADAIAALERSLVLRPGSAVTLANLGSCLIADDRPQAAEQPLRQAIAADPRHLEAWNNLGVALARTGRRAEAIAAYRQALSIRPDHVEAALNLVDALAADGEADAAETMAYALVKRLPGHPRAANQLGSLMEARGALDAAIETYAGVLAIGPLNHPVGVNLSRALIRAGRHEEAVGLTDRLIVALPTVTTPLALKCAALDRLGRSRELQDLMRLEQFVRVTDIVSAPGFDSVTAFNAMLEEELRAHPSLTYEPQGLVTRKGRQSDDLATAETPALRALAHIATQASRDYVAALGSDPHPFVQAAPHHWTLTMWGTILSSGGAVEPHIHAPNWLSGVYYPTLPPEAAQGQQGWFAIGALPDSLGNGGTRHLYEPRAGRMILFPSYLWHTTQPFEGAQDRISFAFDLVPKDIGRPHSLKK
ncbi:tetratricopeptide repeat protein [Sphingobium algorifonticola]|uniref:Tetratricopeptide repeat protein n=1 Tax=Sphingobium algorifonticola TaxID=2008318 RepID=A0A437JA11_9SPHN|nr:tetratricopeptide repeat protein [Sphingobium algorifonticola]RVT42314.1 tetratricopeptide repeat protein [Sphingobium algorifonticola]